MKWMLPDDARRAKALPRMWATMTRHHYLAGGGALIHAVRLRSNRRDEAAGRLPQHVADVAGGPLAPGVLGAQPGRYHFEDFTLQDCALTSDTFFGNVQHPVQPDPARPAFVIPAAAADADPVPVVAVMVLAGQHQAEQRASIAAHHQHGPILALRRVVLVNHPGPNDFAG